jgi:hypothetical protein
MRSAGLVLAAAALTVVALVAPSVSLAAAPPDRHDPCARAGRDTCGTTGVGAYRVARYGVRWFGDFRGAVPGSKHAFCLDLRFWYAGRSYRYRRVSAVGLRNRDGEAVPLESRRRLAYAVWRFGRSSHPRQQQATMLYVHSLMGDARPGEVDPAALGQAVTTLYRKIASAAERFHGPYRIEARLPAKLTVGKPAAATVRVLSAAGTALPNVRLSLAATGASGAPGALSTNAAGVARVTLTPTAAAGLRLQLRAAGLAAPLPHVFRATLGAARENAQRLAVPAAKTVATTVSRTDVHASPQVSTQVSAQTTTPGATISDRVTVSGLGGASVPLPAELWGPFARREEIKCTGTPYWHGSFVAKGDSTTTTQPVRIERAGYYSYRESIAARGRIAAFAGTCGKASETTFAQARPGLTTVGSAQIVRPGSTIYDRIRVTGLGKTPATIEAELYGPFGSRAAIRCVPSRLVWHGEVEAEGDSTVRTAPARLKRAGFYGYRERLVGTELVAATSTPCAPEVETALAAPRIVTGKGDVATATPLHAVASDRPVRLRLGTLGIDAPVASVGIDLAHGVLGIPGDVKRTGWWRDGAAPGAAKGTVLIAGHVDSASEGPGAFFRLARVERGAQIELATAGGRSVAYRVTSVRSYPKRALPTGVFSRQGKPRLVLVTCGGTFDEATGHYPLVVVVTAAPTG